MIQYDRFTLDNGLRVLIHQDATTPMAVVNVLYNVGARDEDGDHTGFAHLFEHLMFGGSKHIPDYDKPLQMAGGENNAYTTNDLTNYYCQLPAANLETAFWLESDRMNELAFSKKSLDVQRKVVCEEFKEHYLNKPYGNAWSLVRSLAYQQHPYQWMTIGKELSHIEQASLDDVKEFFFKYYRPVNAILVVAGNVKTEEVKRLAEKWFGPIDSGSPYHRRLPQEPAQTAARSLDHSAAVPVNALYKTWHMAGRLDEGYYAADLLTEILGGGGSSRLFQHLVKEQQLFANLNCYHFGSLDPGLLAVEGKLSKGVTPEKAEKALDECIKILLNEGVTDKELQKAKNKTESVIAFEDMTIMNRASSLALYELLGDAELMNTELGKYQAISAETLMATAAQVFQPANSNTLRYHAQPA